MHERPDTEPTLVGAPAGVLTERAASSAVNAVVRNLLREAPEVPRIGRYPILNRVGEGGVGVVYACYDEQLDRRVAVKLLREDLETEDVRARMLREAQAMAKLSHPNVVHVYEVGEHAGRVFVAMEFVKGQTLRAWSRAGPRPWKEVLAVVLDAGRGLAAAHEKNLTHRDFKPDNVMVGDDGRVRVMDFGLARIDNDKPTQDPLEERLRVRTGEIPVAGELTQRGSVIGTPAYMAPEQILEGEVGPKADQFAYCVTLWEALYGQRPFVGRTLVELAEQMREKPGDPPASAKVPRWLRKVLERGLRLDPEERHASLTELLAVLERGATRTRKLGSVAVFGICTIVGLAAWGGWRIELERRRARCTSEAETIDEMWNERAAMRLRAALMATGVPYAESTFAHAVPFIDAQASAWRRHYAALCIATAVDRTRSPTLWAASKECLDERRGELASLVTVLTEDADATAVQRAVMATSELTRLEPCLDDAWVARTPPLPVDDARVQALRKRLWRAGGLGAAGNYGEALELARSLTTEPGIEQVPRLRRAALLLAGDLAQRSGAYDASEQLLGEAFDHALAAGDDEDARAAATVLAFTVGVDKARHTEGLWWGRIARGLLARQRSDRALAAVALDVSLAGVHQSRGAYDEAEALHERTLPVLERVLGPDHPQVAKILNNLASVHKARGAWEEAERLYARSLAIKERALSPDHPNVAASLSGLADVYFDRGAYDDAERLHTRALAIRQRAHGDDHPTVAESLHGLGLVHAARGAWEDAERLELRALGVLERALGGEHPVLAALLLDLARVAIARGHADEARARAERALALRTEQAAAPERVAEAKRVLAEALSLAGEHERATALAEEARDRVHDAGLPRAFGDAE